MPAITQSGLTYSPKVKTGNEVYIYYNLGIGRIKERLYNGGSTVITSCGGNTDCPSGSWDATVLRACVGEQPAFGSFPDNAPIFTAFDGTHNPTADGVFADLVCLPDTDDDVLICFDRGFSANPGATYRAVPRKHQNADHYVIQRGENTLSINDAFVSNWDGIARIRGRRCTIIVKVMPEGGGQPQEVRYFSNCMLNMPDVPAGNDGNADIEFTAEGTFDFMAVFSKIPS